jgi:hypothetical protein
VNGTLSSFVLALGLPTFLSSLLACPCMFFHVRLASRSVLLTLTELGGGGGVFDPIGLDVEVDGTPSSWWTTVGILIPPSLLIACPRIKFNVSLASRIAFLILVEVF